jgi:hypothetical protein
VAKQSKKDKKDKKDKQRKDQPRANAALSGGATPSGPDDEIARAEQRLASALRRIDEARAELTASEQALSTTLARHGRLPVAADDDGAHPSAAAEPPSEANEPAVSLATADVLAQEMGGEPAEQRDTPDEEG